jgi:hypothetical protein
LLSIGTVLRRAAIVDQDFVSLSDSILRYLARHPDAADTETGILQWWLKGLDPAPTVQQLREALGALVRAGHLTRDRRADGIDLYSAPVHRQ